MQELHLEDTRKVDQPAGLDTSVLSTCSTHQQRPRCVQTTAGRVTKCTERYRTKWMYASTDVRRWWLLLASLAIVKLQSKENGLGEQG